MEICILYTTVLVTLETERLHPFMREQDPLEKDSSFLMVLNLLLLPFSLFM